ncbi:short-chain dehydrogenase, partial [Streptomyces fulvoviolaceus]|nr:short-chain dehydrogenase [Streptomyces fulvoviolaceus]
PHGIKVNLIAPAAMTRMGGGEQPDDAQPVPGQPYMPSSAVAPMVAYLAHESCPVNGEIYTAGAGRFARLFIASTEGYAHADGAATVEDVAANWDAINDEKGYYVPSDLMAWSGSFLKHQFTPVADSATS